jgi:GntR family transcriptional regulator
MFFSIDPQNGIAIYEQIVRQVKFAVAEGTLRPGQLLPSVRQLAQQLAINPNTIARAFLQLQSDGVLESLRGRGLVVQTDALKLCQLARQELVAERLRSVLAEALHAGLSMTAIKRLVSDQLQQLDGSVPTIADNHPPAP